MKTMDMQVPGKQDDGIGFCAAEITGNCEPLELNSGLLNAGSQKNSQGS